MEPVVINLDDTPLRDMGDGGNYAAKLARVGSALGATKVGAQLHVLEPGKKAFPFHNHHTQEEMYLVLEGEGTLRFGDQMVSLKPMDMINCPPGGPETAHQMINKADKPLRFIVFSNRTDPEVCEYPDSGKFAVASMVPEDTGLMGARISYIGKQENSMNYFDDEE